MTKQGVDKKLGTQAETVMSQHQLRTVEKKAGAPKFARDVAPYFLASYAFLVSHIVYQWTGNLLIPIWLAYVVNMRSFWRRNYQETNLDDTSEV